MPTFQPYFHSRETRPLFYVSGFPVYLATLLTAVHVLALLLSVAVGWGAWMQNAALITDFVKAGQVWRPFTYIFVNGVDIWFVVGMMFLFQCGRSIEEAFGRVTFGLLYALATLVPAFILLAASVVNGKPYFLVSPNWTHLCLLLAIAFMEPNAGFIVHWIKLKWAASAFFVIEILRILQVREGMMLLAFLGACASTYAVLRKAGLGPRFAGLADSIKSRLPEPKQKFRALPGGKKANIREVPVYEPKIRPRPALDREHPAVVEIDVVLDKISKHGFGSLTPEEKLALDKASEELKAKEKRR